MMAFLTVSEESDMVAVFIGFVWGLVDYSKVGDGTWNGIAIEARDGCRTT